MEILGNCLSEHSSSGKQFFFFLVPEQHCFIRTISLLGHTMSYTVKYNYLFSQDSSRVAKIQTNTYILNKYLSKLDISIEFDFNTEVINVLNFNTQVLLNTFSEKYKSTSGERCNIFSNDLIKDHYYYY